MTSPDHTSEAALGDRTDWLLRLLYVPNDRGNVTPMYGRTRLMKACFLLDRKLAEEFDVETDFDFSPHKFGPFDHGVYEAVEHLEAEDLLIVKAPDDHDGDYDALQYSLTPRGKDCGQQLFAALPGDQQRLVRWVKYDLSMKPLGQLLTFVYNQYPDMAKETVLE